MTLSPRMKKRLSRLAAICTWIVVWEVASLLVDSDLLLASPIATALRLAALVVTPGFWSIVLFSLVRIFLGFALGFVAALLLAGLAHAHPAVGTLMAPALQALKSTPLVCVIVLLLMWVGPRQVSLIAVFLVVFPAMYFSAAEALDALDAGVGEMLACFRVSRWRRFLAHVWPGMLPFLRASAENVCGMSWKAGVAAELIGAPLGSIGERIYQSKILLETADLFSWTLVVILFAWLSGRLFLRLLDASGAWALSHAVPHKAPAGDAPAMGSGEPRLEDAEIGYPGKVVAGPLDLDLAPSSRSMLTAASGAGKTTLLRSLAGLLPLVSGRCDGTGRVSMVFQEARLVGGLSVRDNVLLTAAGALGPDEADGLLGELVPDIDPATSPAELSGGQRRRVELARALAAPSDCVFLDEPFAALDDDAHERACSFVLRHLGGRTLLVASHDGRDAERLGARELEIG